MGELIPAGTVLDVMLNVTKPTIKIKIWNFFCSHFLSKFLIFFPLNLHERSGIGWIERQTKFLIVAIFILWVMIIFVLKMTLIFNEFSPITRKIKIIDIFLLFFPFYTAHSASFIKFPPLLREGGRGDCISLSGKKSTILEISNNCVSILLYTRMIALPTRSGTNRYREDSNEDLQIKFG